MTTVDDPSARREQRRAAARKAAAEASPERLVELRSKYLRAVRLPTSGRSRTALPRTVADRRPDLIGRHDLVYPIHRLADQIDGPGNDWLFLTGFPHDLRPDGWPYLKERGRIVARVRVPAVGFRTAVNEHTPDDHGVHRRVESTPTLELDAQTWELVDCAAADTHGQRIRYAATNADGTISHLVGGAVIASHPLRPH